MSKVERYAKFAKLVYYNSELGTFYWRDADNLSKVFYKNKNGYLVRQLNDGVIIAHHLAWFMWHGDLVKALDHINGNVDDNFISNLVPIYYKEANEADEKKEDNLSVLPFTHDKAIGIKQNYFTKRPD